MTGAAGTSLSCQAGHRAALTPGTQASIPGRLTGCLQAPQRSPETAVSCVRGICQLGENAECRVFRAQFFFNSPQKCQFLWASLFPP